MRSLLSIATVLALLSSMTKPLLAATCAGTGKAVSCHVEPMPHCDRPAHHHHHNDDAQPQSTASLMAGQSDGQCPMDCCTPGHPQSGAPAVHASHFPLVAVSDHNFCFVAIVFTNPGFSSHTDRGPPNA